MTDLEVTYGTNADYMVSLVVFWVVLVVGVLFIYRYVWPMLVHMYWHTAARIYWACRNNIEATRKGRPSLYTHSHITKKGRA